MTDTQITDPATDLALFADGMELANRRLPMVVNIRAVLDRLGRAESIAKAATALDAVRAGRTDRPLYASRLCLALDALAEEVRGDA